MSSTERPPVEPLGQADAASLPLRSSRRLLVVGTQSWNPADRTLGRENIRSIQVISPNGGRNLDGLDAFGPHGVRDLVVIDDDRVLLSSGYHLVELDLAAGVERPWDIGPVSDIHELTMVGDRILVANTRHDEVLTLDLAGEVVASHGLEGLRHDRAKPINHQRRLGGWSLRHRPPDDATENDHFHLNQGFVDLDGHDCVLVHHTTGYRPMQHARRRLVGHGAGGVIELARPGHPARIHDLGLRAPHSVRRVDEERIMILDSGRSELVLFDGRWTEILRIPTPGWGRGAVIDHEDGIAFIAISATRARYLDGAKDTGVNQVVAYDLDNWTEQGREAIDGVEQLWSLSLVTPRLVDRLAEVRA